MKLPASPSRAQPFHGVFFEGDSWRFADGATLRWLYPDAFWAFSAGVLVVLVAIQAVALVLLAGGFRQSGPPSPPRA